MVGRALVLLIGVGLGIGMLFPKPDGSPRETSTPSGLATAKTSQSSGRGDADTVLERREDGHFYADVRVNDETIRFMVDTGASGIALTQRDAERLNLFYDQSDLRIVGRGVSGAVSGTMVRLDRVELGTKEVRDLDAAIIPGGLDVSLLGQSFLSKVGSVRIEDDRMILKD